MNYLDLVDKLNVGRAYVIDNCKIMVGEYRGAYWLLIKTSIAGTALEITFDEYERIKTLTELQ